MGRVQREAGGYYVITYEICDENGQLRQHVVRVRPTRNARHQIVYHEVEVDGHRVLQPVPRAGGDLVGRTLDEVYESVGGVDLHAVIEVIEPVLREELIPDGEPEWRRP